MSAYPVYSILLDTKHTLDVLELYGVHPGGVSAGGHIPSQALATIGTERAISNRCGLDGALHNDDALRYRACAQDDNSSPTVALDSLAVHVPDPVPARSTVEVLRSSPNLAASVMSSWRMWVQARAQADCQVGGSVSIKHLCQAWKIALHRKNADLHHITACAIPSALKWRGLFQLPVVDVVIPGELRHLLRQHQLKGVLGPAVVCTEPCELEGFV